MKKIILLLVVLLFVLSCRSNSKIENEEEKIKERTESVKLVKKNQKPMVSEKKSHNLEKKPCNLVRMIEFANVRDQMPFSKSKVIGMAYKGVEYEIIDVFGYWKYVEITGGTDHIGRSGWMWSQRIKDGKVIIEGVCLRSSPNRPKDNPDKNLIAKIRVGASLREVKTHPDFYMIRNIVPEKYREEGEWGEGFVWYRCGKVKE